MASHYSSSRFLSALSSTTLDRIAPHLKNVTLPQGEVLFDTGEIIDLIYFPHSGLVSLVVDLQSGAMIEIGMIGSDSLLGGAAALDGRCSLNKAIVQISGEASVLSLDRLRKLAKDEVDLRTAIVRHDQMILLQAQQSAACNASHTLESRLARWLLRARDLVGGNRLELTQEFLGQMLGAQRSSVSIVAGTLQNAGLIRYRRGQIDIVDSEGMLDAACECYEAVRSLSERIL